MKVQSLDKKAKVIYPYTGKLFDNLKECKKAIFLAGPCPREDYTDDWRNEAIDILNKLHFDGVIINPTNPKYDSNDPGYLGKQTAWELEGLYKASAIVFWIERSEEHPALTTNIEFGQWFDKPNVYCGWTSKATKNDYLMERLKAIGKKKYGSLETMLKQVVKDLNAPSKKWFLSDTHFSQERTLELSKRPFRDLTEMDLTMISNWNKNITMNDEVYFLGDFGDSFDYLKLLNFKKLHFILGNYERDGGEGKMKKSQAIKALKKFDNVEVYDRGECEVKLKNGKRVVCMHEPIDPEGESDYSEDICLYGHIHGRTMYKRNGTDVAVDTHYYTPLSEDEVIWRLNAIKYLDQNVWTADCI